MIKSIVKTVESGMNSLQAGLKGYIKNVSKTSDNLNVVEKPKQAESTETVEAVEPVETIQTFDSIDEIKTQFDSIDMITTSAIAIMLSDTKAKAASPFIKSLAKPDLKNILLKFLYESYHATDIKQIIKLFTKAYYKKKINKHLRKVTAFVKSGISDSLPKKNMWYFSRMRKAKLQRNVYIDRICETIGSFESVKYTPAFSGNNEISDSKRNYKLDHLSDNYKDALIYLVDILLTCTCISKMLFVERMVCKMSSDSEFRKIIENMAYSIEDNNLIIIKSRPIYKQFYQAELGYINGDDLLYGLAITIMVNKAKKNKHKNAELVKPNRNIKDIQEFYRDMQAWLDELAKKHIAKSSDRSELIALSMSADLTDTLWQEPDIGTLILHRITLSIKGNYSLLINALGELLSLEEFYKQRAAFYSNERDKERYLKGDFSNEILELLR